MILIIDNYDSFVYNLAQYVGELGYEPIVYRNDEITIEFIRELSPTHIIISPGPGTPLDAGISNDVISKFAGAVPILGVCLGHQCIAHVFGARVVRADLPMHGKASIVYHDSKTIYDGIHNPFEAGRYHSLIVEPRSVPAVLEISAWTNTGEIMGIRHRRYIIEGVQIHPESILTDVGHDVLKAFLGKVEAVWSR
ncbi:MAG: aminodeoxychorismate/anthranilate synthase component II [Chloroflexi bacterium]|nr:aminodeoxychorismate/anthranilate synthase component II [Chloroflexota bacterium]MBT7082455.1 aminodeoxychorismate/anthranilate synthase component II [Chloroflexota bacterium]MBT7290038.1 aminodeoxychorismate/anthranilate synthase component II [Chloroflexota bacterium]